MRVGQGRRGEGRARQRGTRGAATDRGRPQAGKWAGGRAGRQARVQKQTPPSLTHTHHGPPLSPPPPNTSHTDTHPQAHCTPPTHPCCWPVLGACRWAPQTPWLGLMHPPPTHPPSRPPTLALAAGLCWVRVDGRCGHHVGVDAHAHVAQLGGGLRQAVLRLTRHAPAVSILGGGGGGTLTVSNLPGGPHR